MTKCHDLLNQRLYENIFIAVPEEGSPSRGRQAKGRPYPGGPNICYEFSWPKNYD
jgi:hypothetical protein